jgi:hypothetical protein
MSRAGLLAVPILLAALVNTAAANDRDLCIDTKASQPGPRMDARGYA